MRISCDDRRTVDEFLADCLHTVPAAIRPARHCPHGRQEEARQAEGASLPARAALEGAPTREASAAERRFTTISRQSCAWAGADGGRRWAVSGGRIPATDTTTDRRQRHRRPQRHPQRQNRHQDRDRHRGRDRHHRQSADGAPGSPEPLDRHHARRGVHPAVHHRAHPGARHGTRGRMYAPHAPQTQHRFSVSFAQPLHIWTTGLTTSITKDINPAPPRVDRMATSHRPTHPLPRGVDGCHAS
jgi:hypothetical protein